MLNEAFYSCYPDDMSSFFIEHGEFRTVVAKRSVVTPSPTVNCSESSVLHFIRRKELGECTQRIVPKHIQLALLNRMIKNRWSKTTNHSVFYGDAARLLGRSNTLSLN